MLASHCAKCYLDDVLIHSATLAEHLEHVVAILTMLLRNHFRAHPEKSIFGCHVLEYLGHDVSEYGLTPMRSQSWLSELSQTLQG